MFDSGMGATAACLHRRYVWLVADVLIVDARPVAPAALALTAAAVAVV